MVDFRTELQDALAAYHGTHDELLESAGLDWDKTSIKRRLAGTQPLKAREAVKLASALGVRTAAVSRLIALAESLGAEVRWVVVDTKLPGSRRAA